MLTNLGKRHESSLYISINREKKLYETIYKMSKKPKKKTKKQEKNKKKIEKTKTGLKRKKKSRIHIEARNLFLPFIDFI